LLENGCQLIRPEATDPQIGQSLRHNPFVWIRREKIMVSITAGTNRNEWDSAVHITAYSSSRGRYYTPVISPQIEDKPFE
jgi:hypothetical protein